MALASASSAGMPSQTGASSTTAAAATPSTPSFAFPTLYNFPPFFTLQRNPQTLASQLATWTRLVLDYCQHARLFMLDAEGSWERTTGAGGLFRNDALQRELSGEAVRQVFKAMVEQGSAAWDPPLAKPARSRSGAAEPVGDRILVFWRRPEEWADAIHSWITATGQSGSIMTFFELTEGDLVQSEDFRGLPAPLLRLALGALERQGKARVFEGTEGGDDMAGVKFA